MRIDLSKEEETRMLPSNSVEFESMNAFLIKPKDYVKGTKMAYAGLKKEKDRASIILYLNEQSDSPLMLP